MRYRDMPKDEVLLRYWIKKHYSEFIGQRYDAETKKIVSNTLGFAAFRRDVAFELLRLSLLKSLGL